MTITLITARMLDNRLLMCLLSYKQSYNRFRVNAILDFIKLRCYKGSLSLPGIAKNLSSISRFVEHWIAHQRQIEAFLYEHSENRQ